MIKILFTVLFSLISMVLWGLSVEGKEMTVFEAIKTAIFAGSLIWFILWVNKLNKETIKENIFVKTWFSLELFAKKGIFGLVAIMAILSIIFFNY